VICRLLRGFRTRGLDSPHIGVNVEWACDFNRGSNTSAAIRRPPATRPIRRRCEPEPGQLPANSLRCKCLSVELQVRPLEPALHEVVTSFAQLTEDLAAQRGHQARQHLVRGGDQCFGILG
jgi:hypothetical protein